MHDAERIIDRYLRKTAGFCGNFRNGEKWGDPDLDLGYADQAVWAGGLGGGLGIRGKGKWGGSVKKRVLGLLIASLVISPGWIRGQERTPPGSPREGRELTYLFRQGVLKEQARPHYGRMAMNGLVAGAAAMGLGWYAGRELSDSGEGGILIGGLLMSAAIPVGAYSGNDLRGELPLAIIASYGIGIAGFLSVGTSWNDSTIRNRAIVIPLVQLAASIWVITKAMQEGG